MGSGKKQTVGYKYYLGLHMIFAHGPADSLKKIKVDDKTAWEGDQDGSGQITVASPNLFGGEGREGGVSGTVDVEMGESTQVANAYLNSKLSDVPGHRGVVGLVLRKCYMGMNPYLKRWSALLQRIYLKSDGTAQWYSAKAAITVPNATGGAYVAVDEELTSLAAYSTESGNGALFTVNSGVLTIASQSSLTEARIARTISVDGVITRVDLVFRVSSSAAVGDAGLVLVTNGLTTLFSFLPRREASDPSRRALISVGASSVYFGSAAVPTDTWLSMDLTWSPTTSDWVANIRSVLTRLVLSTVTGSSASFLAGANQMKFVGPSETLPEATVPTDYAYVKLTATGILLDMNPAHIIRECLTDKVWGMGYDAADIDDTSFTAAADTLYTEAFGLSLVWDRQMPIQDFVTEVLKHIEAVLYLERTTGLFVLKLIRNDYVVGTLLVLDESNVDRVDEFSRRGFDELYNSVTIKYDDSATNRPGSVEVQDIAQVITQGVIINTTATYPGISNAGVAARVATRDLRGLSTPLVTCTVYANRDANVLSIGSPFKLTWPDYDVDQLVMRVTGMSFGDGTDNLVRIQASQDVFATPTTSYVAVDPTAWVDINVPPVPVTDSIAIEAPYYELVQQVGQSQIDDTLTTNDLVGFVATAAVRPAGAISARLYTDSGAGYEDVTAMDFCPSATIVTSLDPGTVTVTLTNEQSLDSVVVGTHAQIDDELVVVTDITGLVMTFARGALDTVPVAHSAGARIYFWDNFFSYDSTEFNDGETVNLKILPITGVGQLAIEDATAIPITLNQRALRPYPPGNFKIDGAYFPALVEDAFDVTWAHRDRLQQTSGTIESFLDGNIGPEAGTTYNVYAYDDDTNTLLESDTGITGTLWSPSIVGVYNLRVEVESERGGLVSWQRQSHVFAYTADGRLLEDGTARETEDGQSRQTE